LRGGKRTGGHTSKVYRNTRAADLRLRRNENNRYGQQQNVFHVLFPPFVLNIPQYFIAQQTDETWIARHHFYDNKGMNQPSKTSVKKISAGALAGTSVMTAFSYLITNEKNREFREPVLLGILLKKVIPSMSKKNSTIGGWLIHYGVGFLFAAAYHQLWKRTKFNPTAFSGLMLGGINGVIGVAAWRATFKLHPDPPKILYKNYYGHLLLAHLVFGLGTAIGYRKA
jgi:hypothetical protein